MNRWDAGSGSTERPRQPSHAGYGAGEASTHALHWTRTPEEGNDGRPA